MSTATARLAATLSAAAALVGTALLTAAPAHAGGYCLVVPHHAPIFEHNDPESRVVARIEAGRTVAASLDEPWTLWPVSRADNGVFLGYMKPVHLDCSITG